MLRISPVQTAFRDDKRVLECLQKALRIASSCVDEASSVQLYVQALDKYVYYFEQALEAVCGLSHIDVSLS